MIVFDHHLIFKDEPQFNLRQSNKVKDILYVKSTNSTPLLSSLSFKTDWLLMSDKKIRYISEKPFSSEYKSILWALEIEESILLIWDPNRREILYRELKYYTAEKLLFWILHTFLPLVFEIENKYKILHVGSVEISGKSILFSASSYGGKSTLTDYFLKQGHRLIGDDTVAIEKQKDTYNVIASYPYHRPYREMGSLGSFTDNYSDETRVLQNIYVLKKVGSTKTITINEMCGVDKFKALHMSSFIMFDFMQVERFNFFSEMASLVNVYEINIPWDLNRLNEVYDAILSHVRL